MQPPHKLIGQSALEMVLKNAGCDHFSVTEFAGGVK